MKLSGKQRACIAVILCLFATIARAYDKVAFRGGAQMGYTYGQNGYAWPSAGNPFGNEGRGGFYLRMLRLESRIDFDSTFAAIAVGNLVISDLQEAYLQKRWGEYVVRAGKFRGAGLKSATGFDEFERSTVNSPFYARTWAAFKRTLNSRDLGVELERDFLDRSLRNRFFVHNGSGENIINEEPGPLGARPTQVLGFDYALDWRISPYTAWGGHIGALAFKSWNEFTGNHDGWQIQYWFKSNPVADASLNHQMDLGRFHMFNEASNLYHRYLPNPVDSSATKSWGVSSQVRFEHSERWASLFRYEFYDNTDGLNPDDGLHLLTLGAIWRPAPSSYPGMRSTFQYVRSYEEGLANLVPNDVLFCQLQMLF